MAPTRERLRASGALWCIENVPGAPLLSPIELCGTMFGLQTYRHRLFECSFPIEQPPHPPHVARNAKMGRPVRDGEFIQVVGNFSDVSFARKAIGIDWMPRDKLREAIPPAFAEYVGLTARQIIAKRLYDDIEARRAALVRAAA